MCASADFDQNGCPRLFIYVFKSFRRAQLPRVADVCELTSAKAGTSQGAEQSELPIKNVHKTGHGCSKGTSGDGKM